jgi:hypothetical protein
MTSKIKKVEEFLKQFNELEKDLATVIKEHSDIDKALSVWYHKVEGLKITHVSQSHKLMKEIIPILSKRRDVKIEEIILRSTCDTLRNTIGKLIEHNKQKEKQHEALMKEIVDRAK